MGYRVQIAVHIDNKIGIDRPRKQHTTQRSVFGIYRHSGDQLEQRLTDETHIAGGIGAQHRSDALGQQLGKIGPVSVEVCHFCQVVSAEMAIHDLLRQPNRVSDRDETDLACDTAGGLKLL
jgi:hypothetical protein